MLSEFESAATEEQVAGHTPEIVQCYRCRAVLVSPDTAVCWNCRRQQFAICQRCGQSSLKRHGSCEACGAVLLRTGSRRRRHRSREPKRQILLASVGIGLFIATVGYLAELRHTSLSTRQVGLSSLATNSPTVLQSLIVSISGIADVVGAAAGNLAAAVLQAPFLTGGIILGLVGGLVYARWRLSSPV